MAQRFMIANGAGPTTAAYVKVTTGTAIKTMLQVKLATGIYARLIEWGISFDGSAAATPIEVELLETGTVFATVTAAVAASDIMLIDESGNANAATFFSVGTSATGYTATAEGTITTSRYLAGPQLIAPTAQFIEQFPLGREPELVPADAERIRVTAGAAVNAYCYVTLEI